LKKERGEIPPDQQAGPEALARESDRIAAAETNVETTINDLNESEDADSRRVVERLAARDIQGAKNELRRIFEKRDRQGVAVAEDARRLAAFTRGDDSWGSAALYGEADRLDSSIRNLIDYGDVSLEASKMAQVHRNQALTEAARAYEKARTRAEDVPDAQSARERLRSVLNRPGYQGGAKIELPASLKPHEADAQPEKAITFVADYLDKQGDERSKRAATHLRSGGNTTDAKRVLDGILATKAREGAEGYKEAWEAAQHLATVYRYEAERGADNRWIDLGDVYQRAADLAEHRTKNDFTRARDASEKAYDKGPFEEAAQRDKAKPVDESLLSDAREYGVPLAKRLGNLLEEIGDELRANDNLKEAVRFYEKSRDVRDICTHIETDPNSRRDLALTEKKIGDVLVEDSKISDLLQARRDLGVAKVVAGRNDNDERLRFNLWRDADVLEAKVEAKVRELAQDNGLQAAFKAYRAALLSADDNLTWSQQQLAELHGKIGGVLFAQGELADAKKSYDKGLHKEKLGDLLLAYGEREKAETAAADSYAGAETALLREKLGDAHWASNDDTGAQTSYDDALRHLTSHAEASKAAHDRARLHAKLADAWVTDDEVKAYDAYRESRTIRGSLADAEPANRDLKINLARSHERLGDFLYGVWKQSLKPDKRPAGKPLVNKMSVEKISKEALDEWKAASSIYTELVGKDPRASESLLLVEPLWRVGELKVSLKAADGAADLEKAAAYLLTGSEQVKPYQKTWRDQIVAKIPEERRDGSPL